MKKYISIILLVLFAVVGSAAQNKVSISSGQGVPGDIITVDVSLQNSDEVTAVEVVIPLVDKQLTYVDGSCAINSERINGHQHNVAVGGGALRIFIYSLEQKTLNGNNGIIASFNLELGKAPAEYPLQPQAVLSDVAGNELPVIVDNGILKIVAPQVEVVTQSVDFGHIPIRSQHSKSITLRNSGTSTLNVTGLQFSAPEFTATETSFTVEPGKTKSVVVNYTPTVRGAVEESVTVISDAINGNATIKLIADPYSVNELHCSRVEGALGEEVTVELRMNNMEPIVGLQTTFTLPDGIEYVDGSFAPTERAVSHTATASVNSNSLVLFLYSFGNSVMNGNDGVVATFRLRLKCNSGNYYIVPQNTVLSNVTEEDMTSAVSGNYIVVKSPNISGNSELDFGETPVTEVAKANYSVRNNGRATLVISSVAFLAEGYRVANELPLSIEPGATSVLNVEYLPTKEGEHSTTMNIYSNDPDEGMKPVKIGGTVYEPNNLTFEGENLQNGDYVVSIGLDNYTDIVAVQMDIHWMAGMKTSGDKLAISSRLSSHSCSVSKIADDTYRFIAFTFGNTSIPGNSGKLFDLVFTPDDGVEYRDSRITVDNVVLSDASAMDYTSQLTLNVNAEYCNYYVRFMCEGELVSEMFQRAGTTIVQPQMPEKNGFTFSWGEVPAVSPANDVVYTGEYKGNKYKVDYIVDGEIFATDSIAYGSELILCDEPTKEGYTFSGWSEAPAKMPAEDVTIEGSFAVNYYTVTYKVDGEIYKTETVAYGTEIPTVELPVKVGHTFGGWQNVPASMPAEDVIIEGSFAVNYYTVTYMVDGEIFATDSIAYGSELVLRDEPTKEGYTFSGWSEAPATMPASDITIVGSFAVNYYAITYMVDGEVYATDSIACGSELVLCDEPSKEGYTFSGWSEAPVTMPASDITIEGSFAVNYYTVTYIVDGEIFATDSIAYGSELVLRDEPTKEGYTFSGWSEAPAKMPANDVVINGTFAVNNYNVIYKIDGEEYKIVPVAYGTPVSLIDAPVKEGHTFRGWEGEKLDGIIAYPIDLASNADNMLYSNAYCTDKTYGDEFKGWHVLFDNNPATFFHSEYNPNVKESSDGLEHYIRIDLGTGNEVEKFSFTYSNRQGGSSGSPTRMVVEGSNVADGEYEEIAVLTGMPTYDSTYTSDILGNGNRYRFVRFRVTETDSNQSPSGHPFFYISEFGMTRYVEETYIPEIMPAEDVVINGTFTVNSYVITYMVDGELYRTETIVYDSEVVLPEYPSKEGYTFSGWSEAPATMPASDITIEGSFAVNYYTVTYIVDGEIFATDSIAYGSELVLRVEPSKEGYTFSGWSEAPATMPASDITIEGSFAVNYYTLTYIVDGEIFATDSIAYGSELVLRDEPTKEGYTFSGWSEKPATMPAEDVIIEGSFTVNYYTITYNVDYEVYAIDSVAYGSEIILRDKPIKEGYTFRGWSAEPFPNTPLVAGHRELAENRTPYGIPTVMPAYNFKVYGGFTVNYYTITYLVDGEVYATEIVTYGSEIKLINEPTKEGHSFSGWSEAPATMPAEDITIEGSFAVNYYTVTYIVDGEIFATDSIAYGSELVLRDEPTKDGYTFSGWSEAPATMPAEDITIEGTFAVNYYTVTYIVDGEIFATDSIAYGGEITLRDEPTKEGHTFSGWSEAPATMPAEDVTIEGTFAVNYYTVTYKVDGEIFATDSIAYGSELILRDEPTKEGYTFSGWSEAPATMPASDITIEGSFAVNYYTLTYIVDGEVYATENVAYGSEITLIDEPTKEGYTFSGWSEAPATMPAHDIVVEGTFSPITIIDEIKCDIKERIIYNLRGERIINVDKLERGFYIIDGKKVWIN